MTADKLTADRILARSLAAAGAAAWARVRTLHVEGCVRAGGLSGPYEQWIELESGRHAMRLTLGPAAMAGGYDGTLAWQRGANGEVLVQDAEAGRRVAANDAWINARGWWFGDRHAAVIEPLGRREADGAAFDVLRCLPAGGQWIELWFDASSHLLARLVQEVLGKPSVRRFDDYREAGGLRLPFRISSGNGDPRFDRVTEIATVAIDETPPVNAFDIPSQAFGDVAFLAGGCQARMPIELLDNHVFVAVEIAGQTLRFLLDTGGVNLLAAATAGRIGLDSMGALEARGPGEQSVGSGFARVERLVIGGAVALDRQLLRVLDLPGFDDVEGVRVDGVLGVELFKRLVVQIDYAARELLLAESAAFAAPPGAASLPITFFGHFPGVAAELDGLGGQFWLDTGNRGGLVLLVPFVEQHGLAQRYAMSALTTIGWGIGGPAQGRLARGGRLALGPVVVDGPVLRLPVDNGGALAIRHVAGNIGGEILRRFTVSFDYARRVVHLLGNGATSQRFDVDRCGLWINRHAQGAIVGAVMAAGPADSAGLQIDDVIVAVDGESVSGIGLDALRRRLAETPAGTCITLELRRAGAPLQAALVLRDLV
ncbi:MAG: PDZ domain-containing protein [Vitreoscilla sp.]